MLAFFTVTGFWFWIILVLDLLVAATFLHHRKYFGTLLTIIVGFTAFSLLKMFDIGGFWHALTANPWAVVLGFAKYLGWWLLGGVVYMTVRLALYIRITKRNEYAELKRAFLLPDGTMDPARRAEFADRINTAYGDFAYDPANDSVTVRVSQFKGRMVGWAVLWPLDFLSYVLGDLLGDFFEAIWQVFRNFYQRMADALMRGA